MLTARRLRWRRRARHLRLGAARLRRRLGDARTAVESLHQPAAALGASAGRLHGCGRARAADRPARRSSTQHGRVGLAPGGARARGVDGHPTSPQPQRPRSLADLPGHRLARHRRHRRDVRNRCPGTRPERVSRARHPVRRRRSPPAPELHGNRQPHRRARARSRSDIRRMGPNHHRTESNDPRLHVRPRRTGLERRRRHPTGRAGHRSRPPHTARTCRRIRPLRARRPLRRRPVRHDVRRPVPRRGRRHGAARLDEPVRVHRPARLRHRAVDDEPRARGTPHPDQAGCRSDPAHVCVVEPPRAGRIAGASVRRQRPRHAQHARRTVDVSHRVRAGQGARHRSTASRSSSSPRPNRSRSTRNGSTCRTASPPCRPTAITESPTPPTPGSSTTARASKPRCRPSSTSSGQSGPGSRYPRRTSSDLTHHDTNPREEHHEHDHPPADRHVADDAGHRARPLRLQRHLATDRHRPPRDQGSRSAPPRARCRPRPWNLA